VHEHEDADHDEKIDQSHRVPLLEPSPAAAPGDRQMNTDRNCQNVRAFFATDEHGFTRMKLLEKDLTEKVIGACFDVANELGGGFLESVYQKALIIVLTQIGLKGEEQVPLKVNFRGHTVGDFYPDLLVEGRFIVEITSVKSLTTEHEAQLMNYLKATGIKVGLLVNFGKPRLEWKRLVF
jgi:GxxExxY protein